MEERAVDPYSQHGFACKLDWGREGARRAAAAGDVLIVVDVLSFSTAVITAIEHGITIRPCADAEQPERVAAELGAEQAVHRNHAPARGRYSLSPLTFTNGTRGDRVVLSSLNGATCSRYAREVPYLLVGALVNAAAVARAAQRAMEESGCGVTVLACGERWEQPGEDGPLRVAIEDYLGAGAILSGLQGSMSPEALLCRTAFEGMRETLAAAVMECGSGRELCMKGYEGDVRHAAQLDIYTAVPVMRGEWIEVMSYESSPMSCITHNS